MARQTNLQIRVKEALEILVVLGVPLAGLTPRRKEKMAKAFLVVAGLNPKTPWSDVKDSSDGHQQKWSRLFEQQIPEFKWTLC